MNKLFTLSLLAVLPMMAYAQTLNDKNPYTPITLEQSEQDVVKACNVMSWRLMLQSLDDEQFLGNQSLSPLSISLALSMMADGAAGDTQTELLQAMGLADVTLQDLNACNKKLMSALPAVDNTATLRIANSLWYTETITPLDTYTDILANYYDGETYDVPKAEIVVRVNDWCDKKTEGLIKNVLSRPCDMVLANALYFRGIWKEPFDKSRTWQDEFTCADGEVVKVDFMHGLQYVRYCYTDDYKVASIPFGNEAYSFDIILPAEDKSFGDCITSIIGQDGQIYTGNRWGRHDFAFALPKFCINNKLSLKDPLKRMGVEKAFEPTADFSAMAHSEAGNIYLSEVKHLTSVQIDEEGAVAAAVTEGEFEATGIPSEFVVNRPFLFAISEQSTGVLLFIGKVEQQNEGVFHRGPITGIAPLAHDQADGVINDLQGRRLCTEPRHGVYVRDGKKVVRR